MSRAFSTAVRKLFAWAGYDRHQLPAEWQAAAENFTKPGGTAEQVSFFSFDSLQARGISTCFVEAYARAFSREPVIY